MELNNQKAAFKVLFFPALLLVVGVFLLYPYCQYYIDPDAIAYIAVAKHYAAGDMGKAVNGYWSPWSCWLTAIFIKVKFTPFAAAIIVNTIGAIGFLASSQVLYARFFKWGKYNFLLGTTLSLFLVYAVYKQSFADLWSCFFLLWFTLLIAQKNFVHQFWQWILAGLLCCLAYFAKAYALPFGWLAIAVVSFYSLRQQQCFSMLRWLKIIVVVAFSCVVFAAPWLWLLYDKYGMFTTGTAGSLNLSWYLVGHPYFKVDIDLLLPPVYPQGIYYWEDPLVVNGALPHFYNSPALFFRQLAKIAQNSLKFVMSMNELSAFMLPAYLCALLYLCSRNVRSIFDVKLLPFVQVFFIFPLAYFLINFESRYLWFMLPFALLFGAVLVARLKTFLKHKSLYYFSLVFFLFSFLAFPAWDMKNIFRAGQKEYELAMQMKQANINGKLLAT